MAAFTTVFLTYTIKRNNIPLTGSVDEIDECTDRGFTIQELIEDTISKEIIQKVDYEDDYSYDWDKFTMTHTTFSISSNFVEEFQTRVRALISDREYIVYKSKDASLPSYTINFNDCFYDNEYMDFKESE